MALRMTPNFKVNDLLKNAKERIKALDTALLDQLKQVGEQFVADARSTNTYTDRTRNLRGSIGYVIYKSGRKVFGDFTGTAEGRATGLALAKDVAEKSRGYVLVVVAGMNYAAAVESKGFDVLTGSSQVAEQNLKKALKKIMNRARP